MGCKVDTLTLSVEQKALADIRIKAEGVDSFVTVHLMDYRNMPPEFQGAFDACISLEMLEVNPSPIPSCGYILTISGCRNRLHAHLYQAH
jgi:cyclopropane-fatty-acyl-phospholipid synthase